MGGRAVLGVLLAAFCTTASPVSAQTTGVATGSIVGVVTDSTGGTLPGVAVVLTGTGVMGAQTTLTDERGRYRFPALPIGDYTLVFSLSGFAALRRDGVHVGVSFTATIDAELQVAGLSEEIAITSSAPVIDRHSTAVATTLESRQLIRLPNGRSMGAILAATPAVQVSTFEVGSSGTGPGLYSAYGTSASNRPTVEGVNVSGILLTGLTLNYGSFEEVSVGTAAHSAEWPVPGVQMQFIVKSGGNRYSGTLYADGAFRQLQSFNIDSRQFGVDVPHASGLSPRDTNRLWSAYDVNADVGGYVRKDRLWWYGSVRNQEISARQVNFPVRPVVTRLTNYSAKTTFSLNDRHRLVAYGHVGSNWQPYTLAPFGAAGALNANTAINRSAASTAALDASGWIWKAEWNGTLASNLFAEVAVGQFGSDRPEEPNGAGPRFEDIDTLIISGGNRRWQSNLRRSQAYGTLSAVVDGPFGQHTIKLGATLMRFIGTDIWLEGYDGNVLHVLRNSRPSEVILFQAPSRSESGLSTPNAYISDAWQIHGRLTLNVGVRLDRYQIFLPEQAHPVGQFTSEPQHFTRVDNLIDWNVVAPRVGASYQATNDGRTVVKIHYGMYWIGPGLETAFNANPNSSVWWQRFAWSDTNASGIWEPGEEGTLRDSRGGVALESIDPGLRLPFVHELTAFLERELPGAVNVRSGVVWRGERQQFQRTNVTRPFEAFTVPVTIPDPGLDGLTNTADDGADIQAHALAPEFVGLPQVHEVRNVPRSDSSDWTVDVTVNKRFRGRWSLVGGFAHTWNRDHRNGYLGQPVRANTYPLGPNDLINTAPGGQHRFTTWSAKAFATYDAPLWGLRFTPFLRHQSGQPFGRTFSTDRLNYGTVRILAEPIGTRRMDDVTLLDVRAEKAFRLGLGRSATVFVDVFNVLNANPAQSINWSSGESFLAPLTIVAPRIARIGTTLEW